MCFEFDNIVCVSNFDNIVSVSDFDNIMRVWDLIILCVFGIS